MQNYSPGCSITERRSCTFLRKRCGLCRSVFLMDLWECHKQFIGISKPKREANIDEVVPVGI